jgi:thiamine biosynthesis lipoprotein
MKQTRILMGMPITVEIVGAASEEIFTRVYDYFDYVDKKFSTFKKDSEISRLNEGRLTFRNYSDDMQEVLRLCEETKKLTDGYFDIRHDNRLDPSGLVKGWAIRNAAAIISQVGFVNYYIDAGSDIQTAGRNSSGKPWRIGIRNPFNPRQMVKVIAIDQNQGVATSGTYERGLHIYNPKTARAADEVVSLTVIGPDIYQADRLATPAFAMGKAGIEFIDRLEGFEGYMIDKVGMATMTGGFEKYVV